jgi:hypothetical protein
MQTACPRHAQTRPRRSMMLVARLVAVALASSLVMLACTHPGTTPHTLATASPSQLTLSIEIDNEYIPPLGSPPSKQVTLVIKLQDAKGPVILSHGQSFVCEGAIWDSQSYPPLIVRHQPPGGAYSCVYTDERGQSTQITIPVPPGTWKILNPAAGAQVPIPLKTGNLTVTYEFPRLPSYATTRVSVNAVGYANYPNSFSDAGQNPATGQITVPLVSSGTPPAYTQFEPGEGYLTLNGDISLTLPASGFHSVQIQYSDSTMNYITWTWAPGTWT